MRGAGRTPPLSFPLWTIPIVLVLAGYVWVRQKIFGRT